VLQPGQLFAQIRPTASPGAQRTLGVDHASQEQLQASVHLESSSEGDERESISARSRTSARSVRSYVRDAQGTKRYITPDQTRRRSRAVESDTDSPGSDVDQEAGHVRALDALRGLDFDLISNVEEFLFSMHEVNAYPEEALQSIREVVHSQASQVVAALGKDWLVQSIEYSTLYWQFLERAVAAAKLSRKQYARSDLYQDALKGVERTNKANTILRHAKASAMTGTSVMRAEYVSSPIRTPSPVCAPSRLKKDEDDGAVLIGTVPRGVASPIIKEEPLLATLQPIVDGMQKKISRVERNVLYSLPRQDNESDGEYKRRHKLAARLSRQGSKAKGKAKETLEEQTDNEMAKPSQLAQHAVPPSSTPSHDPSGSRPENYPKDPSPVKPSYTAEDLEKVGSYRSCPTLQRARLEEIASQGYSSIPEQWIEFATDGDIIDVLAKQGAAVLRDRARIYSEQAGSSERVAGAKPPSDSDSSSSSSSEGRLRDHGHGHIPSGDSGGGRNGKPPNDDREQRSHRAGGGGGGGSPPGSSDGHHDHWDSDEERRRGGFDPRRDRSVVRFSVPPSSNSALMDDRFKQVARHFRRTRLDRLDHIIEENLAVRLVYLDGMRPSRMDSNEFKKYDGNLSFLILENWLVSLCNGLKLEGLGGPQLDEHHRIRVKSFIQGEAYEWANCHVFGQNHSQLQWTFQGIIHGLYDRFAGESNQLELVFATGHPRVIYE
jgi:hypothetical protein